MPANQYNAGRLFVGRVPHDVDLLDWIQSFCIDNSIKHGLFTAIGAVKKGAISYYHQDNRKYETLHFDAHMEIVGCSGNISLRDGQPMVHAHIILADNQGECRAGGHLVHGTVVFACEFSVQEILGPDLVREYDDVTGLTLWKME